LFDAQSADEYNYNTVDYSCHTNVYDYNSNDYNDNRSVRHLTSLSPTR